MKNKAFAKVLKQLRERKGFSQESFGFEARLHRTYVSQLERSLKSPSLDTVERICKVLEISTSRMMKLIEQEQEKSRAQR